MRRPALVLLGFLMWFAATTAKAQTPAAASKPATGAPYSSATAKPIHLPLFFEANQGQANSRVQFLSRSKGYTLLLTPTETVLAESKTEVSARSGAFGPVPNPPVTTKTSRGSVIRMQLVGANSAPTMTGVDELPGKVNYLIGSDSSRWQTHVPLYSKVHAAGVYPGVDLSFHGDERQLEYDFIVAPGADPSKIAFRISGAARTEIDARGDLVLHGTDSDFVMHKPVIYQTIASERRPIEGGFVRKGKDQIAFRLGAYDTTQPLVIDPKIGFASFIGGNGIEEVFTVQVDDTVPASPKIYVGGWTNDSTTFGGTNPLPFKTIGPAPFNPQTVIDVGFLAKIDPTATGAASLVYLTFVGGKTPFVAADKECATLFGWLSLDKSQGPGNIQPVVGGETTCKDYPLTVTLNPVTAPSAHDIGSVATRFSPDGSAIDVSALLGGNLEVTTPFTSVNAAGDILITGETNDTAGLPVVNPYIATKNNGVAGFSDCYLARLERSDLKITYATYLNVGQGSTDTSNVGCGAFLDAQGNILAGGNTNNGAVFNVGAGGANLANGFQTTFCPMGGTTCPGTTSAVIAMKLNPSNPSGSGQLLYGTYYSGGGDTLAHNGSFDLGNGIVAIVGSTTSSATAGTPTFPAIPLANAFQSTNNAPSGGQTGFLEMINTAKTGMASLHCSTFLGGSGGNDQLRAVASDAGDPTSFRIVLGGQTNSTDFPTMNPLQTFQGGTGASDGFLAVLKVFQPGQTPFSASLYLSTPIGTGASSTAGGQAFDNERVEGLAVDANHTIYAAGTALSSSFFTPSGTTPNGFQTTCVSCVQTPPIPVLDDGVIFSIGTGGNATIDSITVSPSSAMITAGQTQQFQAVAFFSDGTIGDITTTATWASSNTAIATISNTAGSQGLATGVAGSANPVTITATSGTLSGQASLTVTGGATATHFSVSAPGTATAGTAFNVTVTALDASNAVVTGYTGTVHFTSSDTQAMLPANSTLTNGVGTFSVTLKTAGAQTIAATDTVTASITGTSGTVTVAGTGADLAITITAPSNIALGADLPYVITVTNNGPQDATGVVMTDPVPGNLMPLMVVASETCTRIVQLEGQTTLSCAIGALANGASTQISYHVTPTVAGSLTNTATVAGSSTDPNMGNNSASVTTTIGSGAATHFSVTAPGTATSGTAFSVTVTALDASNAVVTGYTGTVHFTSSDTQAVLPANSTLTNGVGTFSATLKTAGAQTISATDTVTATITGATGTITVTAAAPITLQVKTAGTAFGTVTDNLGQINCTQQGGANPSGNCSTQYPSGTQVTLTATTPGTFGGFVGAPTACTGTGSTCQFTITAAETVTGTFTPGPGTFPLTVVAGTPHTGGGTITSAPAGINCTLTGATTTGTCTQNFPAGTLLTLTSAPGPGSAFFGWSGTAPTCLASSSVSCLLNMSAATTAMVEFTSGGGTVNVTVTGAGNVMDTANAGEINCTNTAGGTQTGTCSGGYTLGTGVTLTETPAAGATFSGWTGASCTNPTATTCSFQVINTTPIAVGATFAAGGGAATHFSVAAPATATAGTMFNLTVTALTASNATATGYTGTVHFTSSDGSAVLPANSGLLNGVGTFPAVLHTAGAQTIAATDTVTASITGVSGTITVSSVGPPPPMLGISKTHVGNFSQGQQGAQYTVTVSNAAGAGPTSGSQTSATVQSTGSIYDTGSGSSPPAMITLPSGATSIVFNSVTGSITTGCASTEGCIILNHGTGDNPNDPDGVGAAPVTSSNTGTSSISGINAPGAGYLVGVFVPAGGPVGTAPTALDFTSSGLGTSFTSLSPQLDQVFFIGDGLTGNGTGTQQTFNIPTGAGQLWLGITDALGYNGPPGSYGDNLGLYTVGLTMNAPGSGGVTVTETAPDGLTLVSMAGTGWTCGGANPANVCTRSDVLAGGASYPAITVSVNVAADATSPQVNMVGVTGGGSAPANASDSTVIESAGATQPLTVVTAGTGTGMVTGNGINCVSGSANACMASLPAGTQVVLTQAGTNGSTFAGWNGAPTSCTVAGATCAFTMPASAETVTATFTAAAATLKSIAVTPANPTEPISSSVQFTATGTFSDNSTKDITSTVTWASSNTEAATINAAGLVTVGGTAGLTTTISATLDEVTGSTLLTVSSSPISISVTPPAGGAFPPVPPGGTLAIGIVLTSTPGFSGTVTFGCTTSSPTITCAPDPATVTLTPAGPTDVAIVLNTFCKGATSTGSVPMPGGSGGGFTLLLLSLTLGGTLWMWRRSPRWAVSFAVLVLMAIGGASCASPPKGPNGATQPGNYTVTFTATVNGVTTSTAPIPFTVE